MCVFVFAFFVMCFFLNFRLVTYNSTNLQFFIYFPSDEVTQRKKCWVHDFALFYFCSTRCRNDSGIIVSLRERPSC